MPKDIEKARVLFVNAGTYGMMAESEQAGLAEGFISMLNAVAEVEVVDSMDAAGQRLLNGRIDVVVFRTKGMEKAARAISGRFHVRVAIMTASMPMKDVIWISKLWTPDTIRQVICSRF